MNEWVLLNLSCEFFRGKTNFFSEYKVALVYVVKPYQNAHHQNSILISRILCIDQKDDEFSVQYFERWLNQTDYQMYCFLQIKTVINWCVYENSVCQPQFSL